MSESFESFEKLPANDDLAVDALRLGIDKDPRNKEIFERWLDTLQTELDAIKEKAPREHFTSQLQYAVRMAVVYFKAGFKQEAIQSLEDNQMGQKTEDRIERALDIMRIADEKDSIEIESALDQIVAEIKEINDRLLSE